MVLPVNVPMDIQVQKRKNWYAKSCSIRSYSLFLFKETIAKSMLRFVTIQYVKMEVNAWKDLDSLFFVAAWKV